MRMEHSQMRELLAAGDAAVAAQDGENLAGVVETLLIMNQQHNLKEENVLYPMCDQLLGAEFVAQLTAAA
jgi:iron-sulfur cluster repair protein YtfE (RIC family)